MPDQSAYQLIEAAGDLLIGRKPPDGFAPRCRETRDGKENGEAAGVDEGGHKHAQDLAREKTKTTVIARQLKRSVGALYQQASKLGVSLGAPRKKRKG